MSRHFSGVSFPSDKGVTVTRGIKSITIPDKVNVAPVIGTITIRGGVSHCKATCERQRLLSVWDCGRAPYVPTQCNQPLEVANAGGKDCYTYHCKAILLHRTAEQPRVSCCQKSLKQLNGGAGAHNRSSSQGDRLSIMDAGKECPPQVLRHL